MLSELISFEEKKFWILYKFFYFWLSQFVSRISFI